MSEQARSIPELYKEKADCCGCGACLNVCPQNAITMVGDICGYMYPKINEELCVACGRCKKVCAFQNIKENNVPIEVYAAVSRNDNLLEKSASGGIFASLASWIICQGGIAYGAAFDEKWNLKHISVDNLDDLVKLQWSKYTHSSTGQTFKEVKKMLTEGKTVLYSGTPCQIAGLNAFLGKKYENLYTVDIICHGVPSNQMFQDYIAYLQKTCGGKVNFFTFRDKTVGWGINGKVGYLQNGKQKFKTLWQSASPYLYYFIQGWLYRENCYICKYACSHRPADITLGDYWGIEKVHPEYLGRKGLREENGISVVIANTNKGCDLLHEIAELADLKKSVFEKAAVGNEQLKYPSKPGKRNEILAVYKNGNWTALDKRFQKAIGFRKYASQIKAMIPVSVKRWLKSKK